MLQEYEIKAIRKKKKKKSHAHKKFLRDYEERVAIYNITGGSDGEIYKGEENVIDYEFCNSADEYWLPIRKLEKKVDRTDFKFQKDSEGKIGI